jgi:hypothetical protein
MLIDAADRAALTFLSLAGLALLVMARRWADAYYDWKPRRFRPRLLVFK